MTANVEQFGKMAAFASLREPAWHGLGVTLAKPLPILKFAAKANLLGWDVRKVDLAEILPDYRFRKPEFVQLRTNPFDGGIDVLATVGGKFTQYQNEDLAALAQTFGTGDYRAETMGSLAGGSKVFMAFVHPEDIVLDPKGGADHIRRYVLLTLAHDGTGTVTGRKTNTRVVCSNTLNVALAGNPADFACRHTATIHDRIATAAQLTGYVDTYDAAFESAMQSLYAADMSDAAFWSLVKDVYPEPERDVKGSLAKWSNKTDGLVSVWNGGTGSMDNLPKNAYRALQAFTEANQWQRQLRQDNVDNALAAGAGFDNATNTFRQDITDRLLATVA